MTDTLSDIWGDITGWLASLKAKLQSSTIVQTAETDATGLVLAGWNYIKTNGLTDAYQIAVTLLTGAVVGTPWGTLASTLVTQAEAAGTTLAKGEESIVLGQAQADLIAAGKLIAPSTGTLVVSSTSSASGSATVATPAPASAS